MPDNVPVSAPGIVAAIRTFCRALGTDEGLAASGLTADDLAEQAALADALTDALAHRGKAEQAFRAAVRASVSAQEAAVAGFRPVRRQASNHRAMTPELRALAGLAAPVGRRRGAAPLPEIVDLMALLRPSGAVFLDWTGPTGGSLRYEVFALDGGAWALIGAASATDFTDRDAEPGARRAYRVQAVRGARRGEVSNVASVYS